MGGGGEEERSRKFAVESDIPPAHIRSRQLGKLCGASPTAEVVEQNGVGILYNPVG